MVMRNMTRVRRAVRGGGEVDRIKEPDFSQGILEPIRGLVSFVVSAGPALAAGYTARAFVDNIGQSASGNVTLVDGDANLFGGQIPSNVAFQVHGLSCWFYISDNSAVPTDAAITALATNILVRAWYAGFWYELGLLSEFLGPYGSPTGLNNVTFPHRFGWPWMGQENPLQLRPGQQFWLEFKTLRALAAGVTASKNYNLCITMPAKKVAINDAMVKQ